MRGSAEQKHQKDVLLTFLLTTNLRNCFGFQPCLQMHAFWETFFGCLGLNWESLNDPLGCCRVKEGVCLYRASFIYPNYQLGLILSIVTSIFLSKLVCAMPCVHSLQQFARFIGIGAPLFISLIKSLQHDLPLGLKN